MYLSRKRSVYLVIQMTKCVFFTYIWSWSIVCSLSRGSSQPKDRTQVSRIAGRFLPAEPPGKQFLAHSSPTIGISWVVRTMKLIFSFLSSVPENTPWELTLWSHLTVGAGCRRTSHMIRGQELSISPLDWGERGERLAVESIATGQWFSQS